MRRDTLLLSGSIVLCLSFALLNCSSDHERTTILVPVSGKDFIYVANTAGSPATVSALTTDRTSGTASSIAGSPFSAGSGSRALVADPMGKFLYVANYSSGDISGFTINSTTGVLTALSGSPFAAEPGVDSLAIDPAGQFLYAVSGNSGDLWAYSIGSTGSLSAVSGLPLAIAPSVVSSKLVMDPSGQYVYAATSISTTAALYGFRRDPVGGGLTPLAGFPISLDGMANMAAFDPNGSFLLVTGTGVFGTLGGVDTFSFNASTGALTKVSSTVQTGNDPSGIAFDASGKFVYIINTVDATISEFSINGSGALSPITGSPVPSAGQGTTNGPTGIANDASGHFIYVCNASNDVSVFSIDTTTGALTRVAGSPFPDGGSGPSAILFVKSAQ